MTRRGGAPGPEPEWVTYRQRLPQPFLPPATIPEGFVQTKVDLFAEELAAFQAGRGGPGATDAEYLVYRWLTRRGYTEPGDFQYQAHLFGGRQIKGGRVADFVFYSFVPNTTDFEVYGVAYHADFVFGDPAQANADDILRKQQIQAAGYTYVSATDVDIKGRLELVMQLALRGESLP